MKRLIPAAASDGPWTLLLVPAAGILLLFFVAPLILAAVFSFGGVNPLGQPILGFSFANYQNVFASYNLAPLLRTVEFTAIATAACMLVGYPVAYLAACVAKRAAPFILALVILPWLVDYLVRLYAWTSLLAPAGLLPSLLKHLDISAPQLLNTNFAVICGLVYGYLPLMILPIYASASELQPEVIEAGKDLYGSPAAVFWRVTFPLTRPGVLGGCLLVSLPMLGDFATAQFLGGPNSTMIGNLINDQFNDAGAQTVGSAYTVALILLLVIVLGLTMLVTRQRVRLRSLVGVDSSPRGAVAAEGMALP